jgi:hypothetical protein
LLQCAHCALVPCAGNKWLKATEKLWSIYHVQCACLIVFIKTEKTGLRMTIITDCSAWAWTKPKL